MRKVTIPDGKTWGRWRYDKKSDTFDIDFMGFSDYDYYIYRNTCRSQMDMQHWLSHMAAKNWITQSDLDNLERAFREVCGFTGDHIIKRGDAVANCITAVEEET